MDATTLPHDLLGLGAIVLLLGVRHGFDADHLATIDALTRHHLPHGPRRARGIGALFSLGHGAVVIAVALLVALVAGQWTVPPWLSAFGAWVSIAILLLLAALNIVNLRRTQRHEHARPIGLRAGWFASLAAGGPLAAAGIGALFALSFDTLSLATLFAVSATQHGGWQGALACALLFTLGMLATDGLNGLWITRLLRRSDARALTASRLMGWAVVAVSLFAAALGLIGQWREDAIDPPDWLPGTVIVAVLFAAFLVGRRLAQAPEKRGV